jgi:hypothetical protein
VTTCDRLLCPALTGIYVFTDRFQGQTAGYAIPNRVIILFLSISILDILFISGAVADAEIAMHQPFSKDVQQKKSGFQKISKSILALLRRFRLFSPSAILQTP